MLEETGARFVVLTVTAVALSGAIGVVLAEDSPGLDARAAPGTQSVETSSETTDGPWGVHLSFTDDPQTTMTATWMTDGFEDPGTTIDYGPSCQALDRQAQGTSSRLSLRSGIRVHEATMTDLEPGQTVAYRVGGATGFSPCYTTHTAPEDGPVRFAVYGDQGVNGGAPDVHDQIAKRVETMDLVLVAGDLTYAEGDPGVWNEWLKMNEDILARVPMMASPGNHEANTPIGTEAFQERLAQPGAEIYYSFDYANVHVTVVQSDLIQARQENAFADMTAFLETDLAQAQQAKQNGEIDHIIVLQHHPFYSHTDGREANRDLAAWEEQFLHRYDVNLLLTGHNHNYERSYPMAYGVPTDTSSSPYEDPAGFIQVITGGGGKGLYAFNDGTDTAFQTADFKRVFHHTELTIDGETVQAEAIQAQSAEGAEAGDVIDSFTLVDTDERVAPPDPTHPLVAP